MSLLDTLVYRSLTEEGVWQGKGGEGLIDMLLGTVLKIAGEEGAGEG